ncbi:hypothetical protein FKM82_007765 [Ascaphus truei]
MHTHTHTGRHTHTQTQIGTQTYTHTDRHSRCFPSTLSSPLPEASPPPEASPSHWLTATPRDASTLGIIIFLNALAADASQRVVSWAVRGDWDRLGRIPLLVGNARVAARAAARSRSQALGTQGYTFQSLI